MKAHALRGTGAISKTHQCGILVGPIHVGYPIEAVSDDGAGTLMLAAIESDPIAAAGDPPIAQPDVLAETRNARAVADPELGELASLRDADSFCIGAAQQLCARPRG